MSKRTLWYACLVLLCCGMSVLVVLATSANKTTLAPTDTTDTISRATADGLFSVSGRSAATKVTVPEPVTAEPMRRQDDVPPPSAQPDQPLTAPLEKASVEISADAARTSAVEEAEETEPEEQVEATELERMDAQDVEAPEGDFRISEMQRKELEIQARELGHDHGLIAGLSDAELQALVARGPRRTSEVKVEDTPVSVEATAAAMPRPDRAALDIEKLAEEADRAAAARVPLAFMEPVAPPVIAGESAAEAAGVPATLAEPVERRVILDESSGEEPLFESAGESAGETLVEPDPEKAERPTEEAAREAYAALVANEPLTESQKDLAYSYMATLPEVAGGRADRERGSLDNFGGPDGYGYRFYDNVAPDTATYSWIELRGDPQATWLTGLTDFTSVDDGYSRSMHPFGFSFPFYGTNYDSFRLAGNGFIQFTTTATSLSNSTLPASVVGGPAIFPLWDDLHMMRDRTDSTVIGYRNFGTYTVIEFDSIAYYSSSCSPGYPLSFEVICFDNGDIKIQYREVTTPSACENSQTVGIQSNGTAGSPALQYVANGVGFQPANGRAIWFRRVIPVNDFATTAITSPSGIQTASTNVNVTATFFNYGSATQTCSVRYQFNGGAIVSGETNSLALNESQSYTFGTQITTPGTPGFYPLVVWTDLPADAERRNDTLRTNVVVNSSGWDCANVFSVTIAGPDSFGFNNAGAGNNTPGQSCQTTAYNDMVFTMSVPNDQQAEFWLTSALSNNHSLKWGGTCPGTTLIACVTNNWQKLRYVNHSGSTQDVFFVVGATSSTAGNFKLAWERQATVAYDPPWTNGFENPIAPPLNPTYHMFPNYWSIENSNGDGYAWENYNSGALGGSNCARAYCGVSTGNDDWLFTPGLNVTSGTTYYVEYYRKSYSTTYPESLEVKVGTSNTSAAMTTTVVPWDSFKTNVWVKKYGSFVAGSTAPHYVGFHSYARRSSSGGYLDSVSVVPMQTNDFRTLAILSPTTGLQAPSSTVDVRAVFQNFGSAAQTCSVRYQFNGGAIVSEQTPSLSTLQTDTHTFVTQITMPATPGVYPLVVWTDLAGDQDRSNDTLFLNVDVQYDAFSCATIRPLTTAGPDSVTVNNCGGGDNDPGQPCGASGKDLVFSMVVPNGQQGEIWQTSNSIDSRHTLRWGGACPGTNTIDCQDSPDEKKLRYVNHTGSDQTIYLTVGGYSTTTACGNLKLAWWCQAAPPSTVPFSSGFDITVSPPLIPTYHTLPDFWSIENVNGDMYLWENSTTSPQSGSHCARAYCASAAGNDDWLFTPGLILSSGTNYYLEYWRKAYSSSNPESLEVWIGTQNASAAMTQNVVPWDSFKTTSWVQKGAGFTVSVSDTYHIGFHSYARRSSSGCYLDGVNVYEGVCDAPSVTVNSATGTTFVTLTASASGGWGGPIQYQWYTGEACQAGNEIAGANLSTYLATASGIYSARAWRVDADTCAACDSAEVTLSSPCTPVVPPYVENFDTTAGTWATCWSQVNANGDGIQWAPSTSTYLNGPNCMYIAGTANGNDDWLFSEPLSLEGDSTYVLEYWRRSVSGTYNDSMRVMYGTARLPVAMTNTLIATDTSKTTAYVLKSGLFTPTASGTYYIGFHNMNRSTSSGTRIDSVRLIQGVCGAPSVTVNSATGGNFATLTATATGGYGGPLQYQWFTGLDCQNGNQISYANASTYLATTSGVYSVRAWRRDSVTCASCDSAEVTLTAPCVAVVPEYVENFDTTAGVWSDCWSQENRNGDAAVWTPSSSTPYSGTNCMYIVGTASGNDDWLFSEPVTLSGDTTYVLEYWRYSSSSTYYDSLRVMYGTQRLSGAMLNTIFPPDTSKTAAYRQKAAIFTPPATATYHIGFHSRNVSTSSGTRIDSVHLYVYGPCGAPSITANAVVGEYSATVTTTVTGGHGGPLRFQWYTGYPPQAGNEIAGQTGPTYVATTSGFYSCTAARGPVDSTQCSAWDSAEVTLTCEAPTVPPMFEGFEGTSGTALPVCWSYQDLNYTSVYWRTTTTSPHTGSRDVYMYGNSGTAIADDWMYTQRLLLQGGTTYWLEYWRRNSSATYADSLEIMYGTLPVNTAMTNVLAAADTNTTTTWVRKTASFTPAVTDTYHIGFHCMSRHYSTSAYTYIDDIRLYVAGTCEAPDSVIVEALAGEDSVTLTADVYGGWGGAPQYQWFTGVGCQAGNEIAGATNATYTTLVSGVFSCRAWFTSSDTCAACDSGYAQVIDCASGIFTPMYQDFEGVTVPELPACWRIEDFNAPNDNWKTATVYPRSGTQCAYIEWDGTLPLDDWLYTIGLNLSSDTTYIVDYWSRARSMSWLPEAMEVKVGRAATRDSMLYTVTPAFDINDTTYAMRSDTFRPATTGRYYFGWHAISIPNRFGISLDDIAIYPRGICTPPDSVKVTSPTGADSALMFCTAYGGIGGPASYQWFTGSGCVNGNQIAGATAESLWVFASGVYSCRAYRVDSVGCAGCASGTATVINCIAGRTPAVLEDFDGVTAPELPVCWTQQDVNMDGYNWITYTSNYRSAPNCAYIRYNASLPHDDWLFSVRVNLSSDTTYSIIYWYRSYGSTTLPDCMEVKIGTAANAASMTTTLRAPMQLTSATYQQDVLTFTPPVTGGYYVGWHAMSRTNAWYIYVDDVVIAAQGTCAPPDSVRANAASGNIYAELTANVYGGFGTGPTYQWYTGVGCQSGNEISGATAQSYYATATGFYSVKASWGTGCSACDSAAATVVPDTCSPVTYIVEGFESTTGTALPTCWRHQDLNYTTVYWRTTTTSPHSGSRDVYMYGYSGTGVADDWLYTKPIILQGGTLYNLNYWRRNSTSTIGDSLEIMYGTIPVHAAMTNVIAVADTNKTTAWRYYGMSFTPAVTDTYYIGFHCMSRHSSTSAYTYLDDIMVYAAGTCAAPDSVVAGDAIGVTYAKLSALVYGGYGVGPTYQWYTGGTCQSGNEISGATAADFYAISSGTYSVKASYGTGCTVCDAAEAFVSPDTCLPVSITPFQEGFETTTGSVLPYCWRHQDLNYTTVYWRTTTTSPHTGTRVAYMYGNSGTSVADDWLYTPPMILQGGTSYDLAYWRRNSSGTYADSLEIMYGTRPLHVFMTNVIAPADTNKTTTWRFYGTSFTPSVTDTYYIGFHCMSRHYSSSAYTYLDDIGLWPTGSCAAPSVSVTDTLVATGGAMLRAVVTGGYGSPVAYQWYRGGLCNPDSAIPGANGTTYTTCVSGTFACRVYMGDSVTCMGCDSGQAFVGSAGPPGYDCCTTIWLTGASDSALYTPGLNMGDNSPGQSCGNSRSDMVFGYRVPPNMSLSMWQYWNDFDSRHSMAYGGVCPGNYLVNCVDDPDYTVMTYTNCTLDTVNVYFVVGGYSTSTVVDSFKLQWRLSGECPAISCTPTVTESGPNGGCGVDGQFNTIACGDVVAGSVTASTTLRDVDAFQLTITEPKNITVTIEAEFNIALQVRTDTVGTPCPDVYYGALDNVVCGTETRTFYNVPAGLVNLTVYPPFENLCGVKDYCMTVTCAPGTPPPGEDCSNPIVLTPPTPGGFTQVLANNQGYVLDYPDSCEYPGNKPDMIYSLTIGSCRRLTFSCDTSGSMVGYDKFLQVFESGQCGAEAFLCNDDRDNFDTLTWEGVGQRPAEILGSFCGGELPAGTYYIRVSNASTDPGPFKLTVYDNGPCACDITCQGGDAAEPAENRYDPVFYANDPDGGCTITPPAFGSINCGATLCGVGFNYQRKQITNHLNRDTDWYLFTLTDRRLVTLTLNAEFPAIMGVIDTNNCVNPVALFYDSAVAACTPTSAFDTLDAGTYAVAIAPRYLVGNPLPSTYRATLVCACIPSLPPTDVTCRFDSADGTPTGSNYWNDMRIRWTSDSAMVGTGDTYTIYYNLNCTPFPGGAGWAVLTSGITPVLGPRNTSYVDLNILNLTAVRRYYVVVADCQ